LDNRLIPESQDRPETPPSQSPRRIKIVDIELSLVELRLVRWSRAERHSRLGQGYPTASPLYRIMRGDTTASAAVGGLTRVESAAAAITAREFDREIEETQAAVDRLPDYLKCPLILAYLDPRSTADKLPILNMSERKFYDTLNCAKHRLVGWLLNPRPQKPQLYTTRY
jgi:hypothetical protein